MHFDYTDPFYVIEGIGLVTTETLINASPLLAGNSLIHHLKMHHVMARGWLVALSTLRRSRARVEKAADLPDRCLMAAGALRTKESLMLILSRVAGLAVEGRARPDLSICNVLQNGMIHPARTDTSSLVLNVATSAFAHVDMKCSGRLHQQLGRKRVTCHTFGRGDALVGGVAAFAFTVEERVGV